MGSINKFDKKLNSSAEARDSYQKHQEREITILVSVRIVKTLMRQHASKNVFYLRHAPTARPSISILEGYLSRTWLEIEYP